MSNIKTLRDTSRINWRNIFYFIEYCTDFMDQLQEQCIDFEDIETFYDLMAVMMNLAFMKIKKYGIDTKLESQEIITSNPRGKVNLTRSYTTGRIFKGQYICTITKTTNNTEANQKIKLAFKILLKHKEEMKDRYIKYIKNCLAELSDVKDITTRDKSLYTKHSCRVESYYTPALALSNLIIHNILIRDIDGNEEAFAPDPDKISTLSTIWEVFLRKYISDYIYSFDKDYTVEKKSFKFSNIDSIAPDIVIYKNNKDSSLLILDAKWYENPDLTEYIRFQLHSYATQISNVIQNNSTAVFAIFGFDKNGEIEERDIKTPNGFDYTMGGYIINVNQSFDKIKESINTIINEQLDRKAAT